jgi:hypothetical protein
MRKHPKPYKKHALLLLLIAIIPLIMLAAINYTVDPLQIYRKQSLVQPRFWENQRYQNAGKLRSYLPSGEFDSIVIGHSQTDNFVPALIQNLLGWRKVLKLTVDGSQPYTQHFMAKQALESGKIRYVLWGISYGFADNNPNKKNEKRPLPSFLYSKDFFDDHPYLLSFDILKYSCQLLQNKSTWATNIDMLNYWMKPNIQKYVQYNSNENINAFKLKRDENGNTKLKEIPSAPIRKILSADQNLISLLLEYPNTHFILFFPPTFYDCLNNAARYSRWIELQKYIVESTSKLANVRVFAFDDCEFIGGNAANYRDCLHYHSGVNLYMLQAFRDDKHRLTSENFEAYEAQVRRNIVDYEILSNFDSMVPMAFPEENEILRGMLPSRVTPKVSLTLQK